MAPDKTGSFSDEITSPLINKDGETVATSVDSDAREPGMKASANISAAKPTAAQIMKSMVALLVATAGALASVAAFLQVPAIIVYVAGGICLLNFPIVTCKERKILLLPSRRVEVKLLQDTERLLKKESQLLGEDIEDLLAVASRFGEVEEELQEVAREQGYNVDELLQLIRENEEIMDMMRENLRQKVIQDVIDIAMRSEKDLHQRVDRVEAKLLALKITVKLEAYGIIFDEDKFLQAVALNPTLMGITGTVRKLIPQYDEHIDDMSIESDKNDVYDMFQMAHDEPQRRGSGLSPERGPPTMSLAKRRSRLAQLARETPVGKE